jgi:hypothetical protein
MRILVLLPVCALLLAGCESLIRVGADGFEVGSGGIEAFDRDAQACQTEADTALSYDVRLLEATSYARNRAFNRLYGRCMTARGHRPRPYIKNLLPG